MPNIVLYVLCYDSQSEAAAISDFGDKTYARIIQIPQSHLFEGVMYQHVLSDLYDEWKDADFVGTIAYSYPRKASISFLNRILTNENIMNYEFVSLLPVAIDPCFNDSKTKKIFLDCLKACGKEYPDINQGYTFCNYWMAKPSIMLEYINFFNSKWLPALESHEIVNEKADYPGALSKDALIKLNEYGHYTHHPFVNERLVSAYMNWNCVSQLPMIMDANYGNAEKNIWLCLKNCILNTESVIDFNESFGDPAPYCIKEMNITIANSYGLIERYLLGEGNSYAYPNFFKKVLSNKKFLIV